MLVKTRKSIGIFSTGRGIEISTAESDEFFIEDDEDLDI
jgi:hypothetical protein